MTRVRIAEVDFRGRRQQCVSRQLSLKVDPGFATNGAWQENTLRSALEGGPSFHFVFPFDERGIAAIEFDQETDLERAAGQLERQPDVLRAAPIGIIKGAPRHTVINRPGDPLFSRQWGARKIRLPEAWGYALQADIMLRSQSVCIAICDSGLPFSGSPPKPFHEDMEDPRRFLPGENYVTPGTPPNDDHSHGTHVAGIAGSEHGKRRGIAGVNWRCKIHVSKVLDSGLNGSIMFLYRAVQDAVRFARSRGWRLVINFSAGGPYDPLIEDIGDVVTSGGALLVAASGNEAGPVSYPAALSTRPDGTMWYPNVCAVGATDQNDLIWPDSNFGPQINVTAPGVDIISAMPYAPNAPPRYESASGTSMAAPFVSGVASLIWAKIPTLAAGHVREQLENTAVDLGQPGRDPRYGFGRIDAYRAVSEL